jgi:Rhodanese-like domain
MQIKSGMIASLLNLIALLAIGQDVTRTPTASPPPKNEQIDFNGFIRIALEVQEIRDSRRITVARFNEMAKEKGTVILDTRADWAFESVHISGSMHLNYSDFSEDKLRKLLPDKNTRILIYCNNNFTHKFKPPIAAVSHSKTTILQEEDGDDEEVIRGTTIKQPSFALNIPTFITLWGYGYMNIYELADALPIDTPHLRLEGTAIKSIRQTQRNAEQSDATEFSGASPVINSSTPRTR